MLGVLGWFLRILVINENGEPTNLMENIPIEIEHIEDLMNSK
jgi:hypothetical protein